MHQPSKSEIFGRYQLARTLAKGTQTGGRKLKSNIRASTARLLMLFIVKPDGLTCTTPVFPTPAAMTHFSWHARCHDPTTPPPDPTAPHSSPRQRRNTTTRQHFDSQTEERALKRIFGQTQTKKESKQRVWAVWQNSFSFHSSQNTSPGFPCTVFLFHNPVWKHSSRHTYSTAVSVQTCLTWRSTVTIFPSKLIKGATAAGERSHKWMLCHVQTKLRLC